MDETLSKTGEEIQVGNTPEQKSAEKDFTTQEVLQDLSGDDWANTATPPLTSSPKKPGTTLERRNLQLGMILLSAKESKKNTFECNKWMFLSTLDEKTWLEFLSDFNQKAGTEATLESFKEELCDMVVKFGELVLMGTGLNEKARKELLDKMIKLRETEQKTKDNECKDSSTLKQKIYDKMIKVEGEDKLKTRGEARVGKAGSGQGGQISDYSDDAPKQICKVSKEEKGSRGVESPVGGCGL